MTLDALLSAVERFQNAEREFRENTNWCGTFALHEANAARDAVEAIDITALRRECQQHAEALRRADATQQVVRCYGQPDSIAAADFLAGPQP